MDYGRTALHVVLASLLVVAGVATGTGVALAAQDTGQDIGATLDSIEQLLQQIDQFLETVVDLLRTVRALGGEGGD